MQVLQLYGEAGRVMSARWITAGLQNFVTDVYQNLFNRKPDQAGLDYWVAEASQYQTSGKPAGSIIDTIVGGAQDLPGQLDRTLVQNKAQVAWYYAEQFVVHGKPWDTSHYAETRQILSDITVESNSVDAAYLQIIGIVTSPAGV